MKVEGENNGKKVLDSEKEYIELNVGDVPTQEIARTLGRSKKSIYHIYQKLGLNPGTSDHRLHLTEVARELGIPESTIRGWAKAGKIQTDKIGNFRRVEQVIESMPEVVDGRNIQRQIFDLARQHADGENCLYCLNPLALVQRNFRRGSQYWCSVRCRQEMAVNQKLQTVDSTLSITSRFPPHLGLLYQKFLGEDLLAISYTNNPGALSLRSGISLTTNEEILFNLLKLSKTYNFVLPVDLLSLQLGELYQRGVYPKLWHVLSSLRGKLIDPESIRVIDKLGVGVGIDQWELSYSEVLLLRQFWPYENMDLDGDLIYERMKATPRTGKHNGGLFSKKDFIDLVYRLRKKINKSPYQLASKDQGRRTKLYKLSKV